MNINKYIQELLVTHNSVVLPGIGLIHASHKSAQLDENNNLHAPGLNIAFDASIIEGQDRLLNYIADQTESVLEDVKTQYNIFLQNFWEKINLNEPVELGDLGTFYKDEATKVRFEVNTSGLFYNTLLGLKPIQAEPVVMNKTKSKKTEKTPKNTHMAKTPTDKSPNTSGKTSRSKIVTYIVSGLIVLVLFAIPIKYFFIDGGKWNKLFSSANKTVKQDSLDQLAKLDSLGDVNEELPDYTQTNNDQTTTNTETKTGTNNSTTELKKTSGEEKHFQFNTSGDLNNINEIPRNSQLHLVAGSFRNKTNAENLQRALLNEGYNSEIILGQNNLRRVTLGSFSDLNTATAIYKQYHEKNPDIAVWLLVIK